LFHFLFNFLLLSLPVQALPYVAPGRLARKLFSAFLYRPNLSHFLFQHSRFISSLTSTLFPLFHSKKLSQRPDRRKLILF